MSDPLPQTRRLFRRSSWPEVQYVTNALRTETVGGALLLAAAVAAIFWANSPWSDGYAAIKAFEVGPEALHLRLSLGQWASDGLLAIFFFVAGLELKREFVIGDLKDPAKAALPVAAAMCGVAVPAILFVAVSSALSGGTDAGGNLLSGWAIPTATDIAFALAVLALLGTHLPSALRSFLLTLAVVDDLVAITIIAFFYTDSLQVRPLVLALVPLALFGFLVQRRITHWWLLLPIALTAWALVHASGIHATVAGILMAMLVPVRPSGVEDPAEGGLAHRMEHRLHPLSAGFAVPVFAFFAAGVTVLGGGLAATFQDPAALGVMTALVVGKPVGVFGGTWLFARFTRAELDEDLQWSDVFGISLLAGIGFTVSLLIGELAYGSGTARNEHVKLAVLIGSLIAAALSAVVLGRRNLVYRQIHRDEERDDDGDGIPDAFQAGTE
ncbi:MAG TPA: Na+/H+ antiporter NhaA [Dermatophilaceae bacterium]